MEAMRSTEITIQVKSGMESAEMALNALVNDDPDAFMQAMKPDLSGRLAQPLVDVIEGQEICCRLPRSRRKWGFVSLQFGYAIHLAILLQSVRVFEALLEDSPDHLAQLEPDGSTVVHSLARCQMYAPRFKRAKRLETALLSTLSREPRLLDRLVTQEDSNGLRPLEACIKFAAFRLARKMLHLPNYLLRSETRSGGWAVRLYDLTDYDMCHGSRCHTSPLYLLTYVASSQVESLKKSKLMEDPLVRQWLRLTYRQTRWITFARLLVMSFPTATFLLTVFSQSVMMLVSSFGLLIHCNRATFSAASKLGLNETVMLNSSVYQELFEEQTVKYTSCSKIGEAVLRNSSMILAVLIFKLILAFSKTLLWLGERSKRLKLLTADNWRPSHRFVRRSMFDFYLVVTLISGLCFFTVLFTNFRGNELGWYQTLLPLNQWSGLFIEQLFLGSNAIFITSVLLQYSQYLEIVSRSIGKLFFTFHSMMTSFMASMPLLYFWIILFSLILFILVDTQDFSTGPLSLYSSVKVILNMVTFSLDSSIVLIIHLVLFVFVSINLLNFLIAFVTETFQRCNNDFEVAFDLLRLLAALKTFRYFGFLFRCQHWLEVRSHGSCRSRVVAEVVQPAFKRTQLLHYQW